MLLDDEILQVKISHKNVVFFLVRIKCESQNLAIDPVRLQNLIYEVIHDLAFFQQWLITGEEKWKQF